jgi:hypothetical protein
MTTSSTPQSFREIVALVAERAKERLPPTINGRLEGAIKIVLAHDVTQLKDGSTQVGSSSDPMQTYHLVGDTCECQDWMHGKAPGGWCRHRIAAGIDKRVRALLPETPQTLTSEASPHTETPGKASSMSGSPLPEAPASINLKVLIYGHECQITLRDADESRLLARLEAVLRDQRIRPLPRPAPRQGQGQPWKGRRSQGA